MAAIFGEGKFFWKLQILHSLDTLWVENFDEIALSRTVKEIEANLCFAIFGKNSKIQMAAIFGEGKIFWKLQRVHSSDTLRVENFAEIALSRTVKEIEANYSKVVLKIHNEVPKWLLLMYWQSYQSQMQYQASYGHNNLVFKIVVKYL